MPDFIYLLGVVGIVVLISKKDGPYNIISKFRDLLYSNKYTGVFSYKVINCPFCFAFWLGLLFAISLFGLKLYSIMFAFACAFISLFALD